MTTSAQFPDPDTELTYAGVGATADALPEGYDHQEETALLGYGRDTFEEARHRLLTGNVHRAAGIHIELGSRGTDVLDEPLPLPEPDVTISEGDTIKLILGTPPLAVHGFCRVVHVVDEPRSSGFAYGTLPGHPERGEESFRVTWNKDDSVTFDMRAFSQPARWWSRFVAPYARQVQLRITRRYLYAAYP